MSVCRTVTKLWAVFSWLLLWSTETIHVDAFVTMNRQHHHPTTALQMNLETNFILIAADAVADVAASSSSSSSSWRQFVPLVVSAGVLTDILLGSPLANGALSVMRESEGETEGGGANDTNESTTRRVNQKERVDTMAVAEAALQKAEYTKDLRQFLEDNKSDWDKLQDVQRKMDAELAKFDEKKNKNNPQ